MLDEFALHTQGRPAARNVPNTLHGCSLVSDKLTSSVTSLIQWETDFYTPQVLGGVANFDFSAPAVYKIQGP